MLKTYGGAAYLHGSCTTAAGALLRAELASGATVLAAGLNVVQPIPAPAGQAVDPQSAWLLRRILAHAAALASRRRALEPTRPPKTDDAQSPFQRSSPSSLKDVVDALSIEAVVSDLQSAADWLQRQVRTKTLPPRVGWRRFRLQLLGLGGSIRTEYAAASQECELFPSPRQCSCTVDPCLYQGFGPVCTGQAIKGWSSQRPRRGGRLVEGRRLQPCCGWPPPSGRPSSHCGTGDVRPDAGRSTLRERLLQRHCTQSRLHGLACSPTRRATAPRGRPWQRRAGLSRP